MLENLLWNMTEPQKILKEIASIYIKVMNFRFLNVGDIDKIIEEKRLQYEEMEAFVTINPYPKPEEMPRIIEIANSKGISKEPTKQLYHKKLLEKLYHNIFDENKIIEIGKEMNAININDDENMKQLFIFTNLAIFQNILEYNYNKNYLNRQFSKMNIFGFTKLIDALWKQNNEKTDETRKIVKEINQEKEKADKVEKKQCSKCKVFRLTNEFKEGRTQCNKCLETKQKYRENHREKLREKAKEYYENNKDKRTEYFRKYREENKEKIHEKIECPLCKCFIIKTHIDRHFNTIKHQMRLNKSLP